MICTTIARCMGNKKAELKDFYPNFSSGKKVDTQQDISMKLKMLDNLVKKARG